MVWLLEVALGRSDEGKFLLLRAMQPSSMVTSSATTETAQLFLLGLR